MKISSRLKLLSTACLVAMTTLSFVTVLQAQDMQTTTSDEGFEVSAPPAPDAALQAPGADPVGMAPVGLAPPASSDGSAPQIAMPVGMAAEEPAEDIQRIFAQKSQLEKPVITPQDLGSLFYLPWEYALLDEAKRGFLSRPPTPSELVDANASGAATPPEAREPGIRNIALSGIAYRSASQWTIWLNGQRLAPNALPEQIIDIKVTKTHVDMKWYDEYTNLIYPIRIRPHQRFNLDARIFLPGIEPPPAPPPM